MACVRCEKVIISLLETEMIILEYMLCQICFEIKSVEKLCNIRNYYRNNKNTNQFGSQRSMDWISKLKN
jgi:hypothetical protein